MEKIVLTTIVATALMLVGYSWDFDEPMTYTYNNETAFKITAPKALETFDEATGTWTAFDGNLKLRKGAGILLRMH